MDYLTRKYVEIIDHVLAEASRNKKFATVKDRMIWERGYLTGLLASLARDDSDILYKVRKKIKRDAVS
jgi:hypothetical protein